MGRGGGDGERPPSRVPGGTCRPERRALPEGMGCPGAGASDKGNCPFEGEGKAKAALAAGAGIRRKAARALESWSEALGLFAGAEEVSERRALGVLRERSYFLFKW